MKQLYLSLLTLFIFAISAHSQDLAKSRKSSYTTKIFRISDKQAIRIFNSGNNAIDSSFFVNKADEYNSESEYETRLPKGHYLFLAVIGNNLQYRLESRSNVEVNLLSNGEDLKIIIHNSAGQPVKSAKVKIKGKTIPYNQKQEAFFLKKRGENGLLSVTLNSHTSYYSMNWENLRYRFYYFPVTLAYAPPLKYIWMPIRDGIKSLIHWQEMGMITDIADFFRPWEYKRKEYRYKFKGYMAFNKPIYKSGDTLKLKAFISNLNGKPVKQSLYLRISSYKEINEILSEIKPYRPGAYTYEIVLHDSLDLKLNKDYNLSLEVKEGKEVINELFRFEEYVLKETKYQFDLSKVKHSKGEDNSVFLHGTDANDLNLLDAKVHLKIYLSRAKRFQADRVFIPDTLWTHEQALDPVGKTKVIIPADIFPPADLVYKVEALFLNGTNESVYKTSTATYIHESEKLRISLSVDSLEVDLIKDGEPLTRSAKLITKLGDNDFEIEKNVSLPYREKIDPFAHGYEIISGDHKKSIILRNRSADISCNCYRTSDSVFISIDNPRKIGLYFDIFNNNRKYKSGEGEKIEFNFKAKNDKPYFVSLQYIWGGKAETEEYNIPYFKKNLKISTINSPIVFPGEKTNIDIIVTNQEGDPVENVDLTAYAYTKKFKRSGKPDIPYFGVVYKNRKQKSRYSKTDLKDHDGYERLPFQDWSKEFGLDSMAYYDFLYPGNEIYRNQRPIYNQITQISPFVIDNGVIEPVMIIYINRTPVYFRNTNTDQRYSVRIDTGYHDIQLRTRSHLIELDSFYVKPYHKSIISVDVNSTHSHVYVKEVGQYLTAHEIRKLTSYMILIKDNFENNKAVLEQNGFHQLLTSRNYNQGYILAGPIKARYAYFSNYEGWTNRFLFEPNYSYEFQNGFLKMKEKELRSYLGINNSSFNYNLEFNDSVLSGMEIQRIWKELTDKPQVTYERYENPTQTLRGHGRLEISIDQESWFPELYIKNIIIAKNKDLNFLRIYPGKSRVFHQLQPGQYEVFLLLEDDYYIKYDPIQIKRDGLNYFHFNDKKINKSDTFSIKLNELVKSSTLYESNYLPSERKINIHQARQLYNDRFKQPEFDKRVEGFVTDVNDGGGIPGVNVLLKGSLTGTVTDVDGFYSLDVPANAVLVFAFIGYITQETQVGSRTFIDVVMEGDVTQMSEVVVTAMGVSREKKSLGYSVSNLNALHGKVAGVSISSVAGSPGSQNSITIRGTSSVFGNGNPLIIIDGVPQSGSTFNNLNPDDLGKITILKSSAATAIYGARAADGAIIISTKSGFTPKGIPLIPEIEMLANSERDAVSSIRSNFSDYAFWQPKLATDKNGKTSFKVLFPDDITGWRFNVLAMGPKKQSGFHLTLIKSVKSLSASLAVPRFMIAGDSINVIGRSLNYNQDTIQVRTTFKINNKTTLKKERDLANSITENVLMTSTSDTMNIEFKTQRIRDNYFDGELRKVPVLPIGTREVIGNFYSMKPDSTYTLKGDPKGGKVQLTIQANALNIIRDEINHLRNYKFLCNEQITSKLKALLLEEEISKKLGERFKYQNEVRSLIHKLEKNQNSIGTWGWWNKSHGTIWITVHAAETLQKAENMGYKVKIDKELLLEHLTYLMNSSNDFIVLIRIVNLMKEYNERISHGQLIQRLESDSTLSKLDYISLLTLKQELGSKINTDSLMKLSKTTLLGNYYWERNSYSVYKNSTLQTLLAYRLLRKEGANEELLRKIRDYFFEIRQNGHWRNTYESSLIIEELMNEILKDQKIVKPELNINGLEINTFPFQKEYSPSDSIMAKMSGDFPVYISSYQTRHNSNPDPVDSLFAVSSYLISSQDTLDNWLQVGSKINYVISIEVKKEIKFGHLEIPIPAGCTYGEKPQFRYKEAHREYDIQSTNIFIRKLSKGIHKFEVELIPRYTGKYHINPVRLEHMYFPVFFGRNEVNKIGIE